MNRSRYSTAPASHPPKPWSQQDARSGTTARPASNLGVQPAHLAVQPVNLAIQPAENVAPIKLKKKSVKIVPISAAASTATSVKSRATTPGAIPTPAFPVAATTATPALATRSSPASGDGQRKHEVTSKPEDAGTTAAAPLTSPEPDQTTIPIPEFDSASSLEELFARLSARSPTSTSPKASPNRLNLSMFSFDNTEVSASCLSKDSLEAKTMSARPDESPASKYFDVDISPSSLLKAMSVRSDSSEKALHHSTNLPKTTPEAKEHPPGELNEIEREYLRKASEYVSALPTSNNTPGHLFKTVTVKMHNTYAPVVKLDLAEADKLKARYAFAVVNFINQNVKLNTTPLTADKIKDMLQCNDGSFLTLCATLIEEKYMALENLDHVVGLCKTVLDVLPKAIESSGKDGNVMSPNDRMDKVQPWPVPEKRKAATHRVCTLTGISGLALSEITPLIWGGALESLIITPASDTAVVRFLTPTACTTYLAATANGIIIPADPSNPSAPKRLILVEPQLGPCSINDVIQSCIDAEQTRCVRALGADDDWSDAALMKLALGPDKAKRDVERIKKGRTAKGVYTIEFRFGNIYHALGFRRQLMTDEAWEHCHLQFAKDPCELASGVHVEDAE